MSRAFPSRGELVIKEPRFPRAWLWCLQKTLHEASFTGRSHPRLSRSNVQRIFRRRWMAWAQADEIPIGLESGLKFLTEFYCVRPPGRTSSTPPWYTARITRAITRQFLERELRDFSARQEGNI